MRLSLQLYGKPLSGLISFERGERIAFFVIMLMMYDAEKLRY